MDVIKLGQQDEASHDDGECPWDDQDPVYFDADEDGGDAGGDGGADAPGSEDEVVDDEGLDEDDWMDPEWAKRTCVETMIFLVTVVVGRVAEVITMVMVRRVAKSSTTVEMKIAILWRLMTSCWRTLLV